MSLPPHELPRPPEPPPKALRSTGINWMRRNLFNSVFNGALTVLLTVGLLVGILAVLRFLFSPERRWEVIPPNAVNYAVGSYPREDLANVWRSVWIIAALVGLSTVFWGLGGRVSLIRTLAGVRAAGVTVLVVGGPVALVSGRFRSQILVGLGWGLFGRRGLGGHEIRSRGPDLFGGECSGGVAFGRTGDRVVSAGRGSCPMAWAVGGDRPALVGLPLDRTPGRNPASRNRP